MRKPVLLPGHLLHMLPGMVLKPGALGLGAVGAATACDGVLAGCTHCRALGSAAGAVLA